MPVYNAQYTVEKAVRSVLHQTLSDFELIVVDDGSTDRTASMLGEVQDGRLRVVRNPINRGISHSLNCGLDRARGRYLARMDADDVSHPHRLEYQVAFLEAHPELALCGCWVRDAAGSGRVWRQPTTPAMIAAALMFFSALAHPTVIWRRDHPAMANVAYDPNFDGAEDYELWTRLTPAAPMANLDRILVDYRMPESQREKSRRGLVMALHARELRAMGLAPEVGELELHGAIARADWQILMPRLDAVLPWLLRLESANAGSERIPAAALRVVLAERYFRVCFLAARAGMNGWRRFYESGFADALHGQWAARIRMGLRSMMTVR